MKHRLKNIARTSYARLLYHTGLHALVDRLMPKRLVILCGHCVDAPATNGELPADMKVSPEKLRTMLRWFGRRYELCTLAEGLDGLAKNGAKSMVALTMDDGYRDNIDVLPDLLDDVGARATVFLESRPLDERRVNWSHKYFWLLVRIGAERFGERFVELCEDSGVQDKMRKALSEPSRHDYHVKRVVKYELTPEDRDPLVDRIFEEEGGDERALCNHVYMDWSDAKRLEERGIEVGGHTVTHPVLATLAPERQAAEVREGKESLTKGLGHAPRTFAYPFGRRWDFNDASAEAVRAAGFECAVTTHAGVNGPASDRMRLHRLTFDEDTQLHLLVAEACGGFELMRRFGINLSQ